MYAVSGRIIDRIGTRRSFMIFVSAWSLANMLHGLANSARQFAGARFLLGAAEPANFPAGVRAVSEWFPVKERALAIGIFNAGTALGSAVAVPTVSIHRADVWLALGVRVHRARSASCGLRCGRCSTGCRPIIRGWATPNAR